MDLTFWVIQAVLLAPVLVMAASAGMEEKQPRRGSPRSGARARPVAVGSTRVRALDRVAVAVSGLSQFTVEQQARLVLLRRFVQDAKLGHGALRDDLMPDGPTLDDGDVPGGSHSTHRGPRRTLPRPSGRQLALIGGALLIVVGLVGIVRTSIAMDNLAASSTSAVASPSMAARLLPGVIANPSRYLSAVNSASGGSASSGGDPLYQLRFMWLKQAMDRWEALVGFGLALILFASKAATAGAADGEETSVASDAAPFLMVAALLFAALSFFELP